MVPTILVLLLLISYPQPISSTSGFQTSESRALKQSNGPTHKEFLERLSHGSILKGKKKTMVLDEKVEERKKKISNTLRKAHGRSGARGSSGSGSVNIHRRPYSSRNSATSTFEVPCFWASKFTLSAASFAFFFIFIFN